MSILRRDFLKRAALGLGAAAASQTTRLIADDKKPASSSPNERLGVAVIGCGGRGNEHIGQWASSAKNTEILYLCDVDTNAGGSKIKAVGDKQGREPQYAQDFRSALEDPAVDIVSIATPNHWHSLQGILAMQAGKDVYVEKPVSHNVWEGRQLALWAKKLNRFCQCGTQSRSSPSLMEAHQWIHEGNLGAIKYAVGTCYKPRTAIGKLDKPLQIPDSIDYDLWCGPAAKVDLYRPRLHYDWHWDWNTGNGDMGNQGIHQMDIARWFLNEDALSPEVISIGGRLGYDDAGNTPNTQTVIHLYEKAPLIFETRGLPKDKAAQGDQNKWGADAMDSYKGSRVGVLLFCEKGVLVIPNYVACAAFDYDGKKLQEWKGGGDHFGNLADAMRSGKTSDLRGQIVDGHLSSALCHTGGLSDQLGRKATAKEIVDAVSDLPQFAESFERMADHLRKNEVNVDEPVLSLGARLKMDPQAERFTNSDEANRLLTRDYRAGYVVPDANT